MDSMWTKGMGMGRYTGAASSFNSKNVCLASTRRRHSSASSAERRERMRFLWGILFTDASDQEEAVGA
jgi:hypothetical protein